MVCKNGTRTGSTCGTIIDNTASSSITTLGRPPADVSNMLRIDGMCMLPGDSGSPVTAASVETAVGILSADNFPDPNTCAAAPNALAEPVGRALLSTGVVIYGG